MVRSPTPGFCFGSEWMLGALFGRVCAAPHRAASRRGLPAGAFLQHCTVFCLAAVFVGAPTGAFPAPKLLPYLVREPDCIGCSKDWPGLIPPSLLVYSRISHETSNPHAGTSGHRKARRGHYGDRDACGLIAFELNQLAINTRRKK